MNEDEFARALLAHERVEWQDPERIVFELGLQPGSSVADLACGPGFFTIQLAKAVGPRGQVYAIDLSKVMLSYLSSKLKRINIRDRVNIIRSDITMIGLGTSAIDCIFLANVLHDITDHSAFFSEIRRISKKNATIAVIDWKKEDTGIGPEVKLRLSESTTLGILGEYGYESKGKVDPGPFHYGFVFTLKENSQLFGNP